jgi:hypothetical protein
MSAKYNGYFPTFRWMLSSPPFPCLLTLRLSLRYDKKTKSMLKSYIYKNPEKYTLWASNVVYSKETDILTNNSLIQQVNIVNAGQLTGLQERILRDIRRNCNMS